MQFCWVGALLLWLPLLAPAFAQDVATFVGAEACAGCHALETERWKTSHHALAMQKATATAVLGDFANATRTHHGLTTTFARDGDKFVVRTEGPDGALHDYEIAYTLERAVAVEDQAGLREGTVSDHAVSFARETMQHEFYAPVANWPDFTPPHRRFFLRR